jgi:hypothetical protein
VYLFFFFSKQYLIHKNSYLLNTTVRSIVRAINNKGGGNSDSSNSILGNNVTSKFVHDSRGDASMKTKILIALGMAVILALGIIVVSSAVSGAAFTTFNPWVDGLFKDVCKNSIINCNIYGMKQDVWLNGGPAANGLGPDGQYFFAVLVPGGQPNPNDGGLKNLSDDYDKYTNRTFTVTDGEVSAYTGDHWLDSGNFLDPNRQYCHDKRGCLPDKKPPLIRLFPYADTTNPGGVYILAICYIGQDGSGYPVAPRDCKYDAFKVRQNYTASLYLSGIKFEDIYADGKADWVLGVYMDPGLQDWTIKIDGTGFFNEPIHATVTTDKDGFWSFQKDYTYTKTTVLYTAKLTICEDLTLKPGWVQSYPDPVCYYKEIAPAELAKVEELDFGNWYPGEKSGLKFEDLDADGAAQEAGEPGLAGWTIYVDYDNDSILDQDEPSAVTGVDGKYTIKGVKPGEWTVREVLQKAWTCSYPNPCNYVEKFYSQAKFTGNDFGNWYPATKGGYKWYDRNGDGIWDAGEPVIPGWKIQVYDANNVLVASQFTDQNGYYEFTLNPGFYTVQEVCPNCTDWYQTWPVPTLGCGSGVYPVTLTSSQVETDNNFGNYCLGHANFDTKGYWHNKNGLTELYNDSTFKTGLLLYINGLDPYNDPTDYFGNGDEPFDGYFSDSVTPVPPAIDSFTEFGYLYNEISQFLVDPNATGGGGDHEQLAQQLLAFIFNVNYRLGDPNTVIYANGKWMSAQSIIDAAVAAWTSPTTDDDKVWEPILDGLNNNDSVPFIPDEPCMVNYLQ